MNNEFNFEYFVPTPDTTANCALSRWNDGLFGLSDFIKSYMSSQQDVCFGFNRPLNLSELIHLITGSNLNGKGDYILDYKKYGDLKAKVCGFDIPLLNNKTPLLFLNWYYDKNEEIFVNNLSVNRVAHVINKNSNYNSITRKSKFIEAINAIIADITNEYSNDKLKYYFGDSFTKNLAITALTNVISELNNLTSDKSNFIFGFNDKDDFNDNVITSGYTHCNYNSISSTTYINDDLFKDIAWFSDSVAFNETPASPELPFLLENINYIIEDYFNSRGLDVVLQKTENPAITYSNSYSNGHIFICFKFLLKEYPVPSKFLSHDGSYIPLSKQTISIKASLVPTVECYGKGSTLPIKILWDSVEEKPVYIDENGNANYLTNESQDNYNGGVDYTIWSTPVQKTGNGFKFECIMPLAFYNSESNSYNNEYYSINSGNVLYRVPVFRKIRQNVEDVVFDEQKAKALNNITNVDSNSFNKDETVVLGGAVIDDFTSQLYTVVDKQEIASFLDYGNVKVTNIDSDTLAYLDYYMVGGDYVLPEQGRCVDAKGVVDIINGLVNNRFVYNTKQNTVVNINSDSDISLSGDDVTIYSNTTTINGDAVFEDEHPITSSGLKHEESIELKSYIDTHETKITVETQDESPYGGIISFQTNNGTINLQANNITTYGSIIPNDSDGYYLGTESKKWWAINTRNIKSTGDALIKGLAPTNNYGNISIGSLALVLIQTSALSPDNALTGCTLYGSDTHILHIYFARFACTIDGNVTVVNQQSLNEMSYSSSSQFLLLNDIKLTGLSLALIMRIEDSV